MLTKIAMIVIFFAPNGAQYKDFVGAFDTVKECETVVAMLKKQYAVASKDGYYFAACTKAKPLNSTDV